MIRALWAVVYALRHKWTVAGIVGTLQGAPRDMNGEFVVFCQQHCGRLAVGSVPFEDSEHLAATCAECAHRRFFSGINTRKKFNWP